MFLLNMNRANEDACKNLHPATPWESEILSEGISVDDLRPWLGVPCEGAESATLRNHVKRHFCDELYLSKSSFIQLEKGGHPTPTSYTAEKKIPIYVRSEKEGLTFFRQIGFLFRWTFRSAWTVVLFSEMSGYSMIANLLLLVDKNEARREVHLPIECATVRVSTLFFVAWLMAHPELLMPMVGVLPLLNINSRHHLDARLIALTRLNGAGGLTLKNYFFTNRDPMKICATLRIDPLNVALPGNCALPVSVVHCAYYDDPHSPDKKKFVNNEIIDIGRIDSLLASLRFISAAKWDFVAPSLHCCGVGYDCFLGIPSLKEVIALLKKGVSVSD